MSNQPWNSFNFGIKNYFQFITVTEKFKLKKTCHIAQVSKIQLNSCYKTFKLFPHQQNTKNLFHFNVDWNIDICKLFVYIIFLLLFFPSWIFRIIFGTFFSLSVYAPRVFRSAFLILISHRRSEIVRNIKFDWRQ